MGVTPVTAPDTTGATVLAEIQTGGVLTLSAAGWLFPAHRGAGNVNPSTVFRWMKQGAKSSGGQIIRLEAVRVGGRWLTSRPAITRFVQALTDATPTTTPPIVAPARPRTDAARQKASARAARELEKRGA